MSEAPSQSVRVDLGDRSYDVTIGTGTLDQLTQIIASTCPSSAKAMLVLDHNLPQATVERAAGAIQSAGLHVFQQVLIASEEHKSTSTHADLLVRMAQCGLDRQDIVVTLGGGIVGDVGAYAAATYMRGIRCVQCPTTLLSMVDASVGGKTGVNLLTHDDNDTWSLLKNYAGCFWQPRAVVADISTLASLAPRHYRAGIAECLKHTLLSNRIDPDLLDWTHANLDRIIAQSPSVLTELVTRNVAVKARVVEGDEREESTTGPGRAALNLGHTFAHVLEGLHHLTPTTNPSDAPLLHGECVAMGLIAASSASASLELVPQAMVEGVAQAVADAGLPSRIDALPDNETLRSLMLRDKKTRGSTLRLILPVPDASVVLRDDVPSDAIDDAWNAIRA
ncbi:MAG: 3-dehydroquinate synthase family protein [Phycisphaerales bacterium JB043]